MTRSNWARSIAASRGALVELPVDPRSRDGAAEGGCGVIGIACSERIAGRHLLQALRQMRNRGNGKGGGAALVGLDPGQLGVTREQLRDDYLLAVAYMDDTARAEVEEEQLRASFEIDHVHEFPLRTPTGLEPRPPRAVGYFVRPKRSVVETFAQEHGLPVDDWLGLEEEWVYQNTYRLNVAYYASLGEQRAFVLSHGKDMLALKMVGYGDDVIETYGLQDMRAHVWIGHHRYPTKGRVWHPGGAHPFVGMHEALVHNGDFANYASVCTYLAQHNIRPLFLTDTEVSVLVFDLHHRTFGYPLEHVIESLAPTTERDFSMLPADKQPLYRALQTVHMHGSPDGPWFFLIAQSEAGAPGGARTARLLGITDTSMLRPQVFALQQGEPGMPSIGFAASEKQAIDASLASLAASDSRFWSRPDKLWVARGGSYTDGGAFLFDVVRSEGQPPKLICRDKFGRHIALQDDSAPLRADRRRGQRGSPVGIGDRPADEVLADVGQGIRAWDYEDYQGLLAALLQDLSSDQARSRALTILTGLIDRRLPTGQLRRSSLLSLADEALAEWVEAIRQAPSAGYQLWSAGQKLPAAADGETCLVIDAPGFTPEGEGSLAAALVAAAGHGHRRLIVTRVAGQRFVGNGLGPGSHGLRIDVYGSPGDYLGSGLDGAEMVVHGNGQDQLAQIMKRGRLVVHGDVGQTFLYAAKGGEVYVLGSAAGRPLINAVGSPRVVINGTCLDYLAESFMAGDPLNGGGFVVLNGVGFNDRAELVAMDTPYPGGNLFSLASGGAIFVRDPHRQLGTDQLNGGDFSSFQAAHWQLIEPMLRHNEELFGIPIEWLLTVDGELRPAEQVYRAIVPVREKALLPEEAWVAHG